MIYNDLRCNPLCLVVVPYEMFVHKFPSKILPKRRFYLILVIFLYFIYTKLYNMVPEITIIDYDIQVNISLVDYRISSS